MPSPVSSTDDTVTFSLEGFGELLRLWDVAEGNYRIAEENAAAASRQSQAYNYLIEAGKLQQQFTKIREEQLARERRDHFLDNWFHRGLIALGLIAVGL